MPIGRRYGIPRQYLTDPEPGYEPNFGGQFLSALEREIALAPERALARREQDYADRELDYRQRRLAADERERAEDRAFQGSQLRLQAHQAGFRSLPSLQAAPEAEGRGNVTPMGTAGRVVEPGYAQQWREAPRLQFGQEMLSYQPQVVARERGELELASKQPLVEEIDRMVREGQISAEEGSRARLGAIGARTSGMDFSDWAGRELYRHGLRLSEIEAQGDQSRRTRTTPPAPTQPKDSDPEAYWRSRYDFYRGKTDRFYGTLLYDEEEAAQMANRDTERAFPTWRSGTGGVRGSTFGGGLRRP
jgi:hypothetical protein